jgi:hypothetical protein
MMLGVVKTIYCHTLVANPIFCKDFLRCNNQTFVATPKKHCEPLLLLDNLLRLPTNLI